MIFDLRDVLRGLGRDRGYSAIVVLTLALTIGATTAVFAIVNGILLKPLAYDEAHRLVVVNEVVREFADQYPMLPVNPRHFDRWREQSTTFESMAEYNVTPANVTGLGEAAQVQLVRTSGTLFEVLHVKPALGRLLSRVDEGNDEPRVAVVSHAIWRDRMSADPSAIGRSIVVNGAAHTVVGVLPADAKVPTFSSLIGPGQLTAAADVFVPLRLNLQSISPVGDFNYAVVGRLKAGTTIDSALAELDVLQADIAREAADETKQSVGLRALVRPLSESIVGGARRGLVLLLAAIGAVLMVACSNLANLSLTRTLARLRDAAIRTALGASGRQARRASRHGAAGPGRDRRCARHRRCGDRAARVRRRPRRSSCRASATWPSTSGCWPSPHSSRASLDWPWRSSPRGAWRGATCRTSFAPEAAPR